MRRLSDFEVVEGVLAQLKDRNPDINVAVASDESHIRVDIVSQSREVTFFFNPAGMLDDMSANDS